MRASTLEGLKKQPGRKPSNKLPGAAGTKDLKPGDKMSKPGQGVAQNRPTAKKKAGAKVDKRAKSPSPLGDVNRGAVSKKQSNRGAQSMGGGGYKRPSGGSPTYKKRKPSHGGYSGGGRSRGGGGGGRGGGGRRGR